MRYWKTLAASVYNWWVEEVSSGQEIAWEKKIAWRWNIGMVIEWEGSIFPC